MLWYQYGTNKTSNHSRVTKLDPGCLTATARSRACPPPLPPSITPSLPRPRPRPQSPSRRRICGAILRTVESSSASRPSGMEALDLGRQFDRIHRANEVEDAPRVLIRLHLLHQHADVHHGDILWQILLLPAATLPHLGEVARVEENWHDLRRLQLVADEERQLPAALVNTHIVEHLDELRARRLGEGVVALQPQLDDVTIGRLRLGRRFTILRLPSVALCECAAKAGTPAKPASGLDFWTTPRWPLPPPRREPAARLFATLRIGHANYSAVLIDDAERWDGVELLHDLLLRERLALELNNRSVAIFRLCRCATSHTHPRAHRRWTQRRRVAAVSQHHNESDSVLERHHGWRRVVARDGRPLCV